VLKKTKTDYTKNEKKNRKTVDTLSKMMVVYTSRQHGTHKSRNARDTDGYLIGERLYDQTSRKKLEKSA
tara:strand:+ start:574 stop:780 length:207 start_codon:yes stop_codon:yes gene_type:complete